MKDQEVLKKVDRLFASVEKEIVESEDYEEFWWYAKNLPLTQADVEDMPTDIPKAQFLHILSSIMQHGIDDEDIEDLMSLSDTLPFAGYIVGNIYLDRRTDEDDVESVKWFRKAAMQGYDEAQLRLGNRYDAGLGVEEDQQMAFFWYWKAAEQGNAIAQLNVGYAYENGDGVDQDMKTALDWYRKSAGHEDGFEGAYVLGECYEQGKGVEKNLKEALRWYQKAASKSYDTAEAEEAIRRLKSLVPSAS